MSDVFEDIKKARKEIHDATGIQEYYLYGTIKMFIEMDIDVKQHGEHLSGDCYRIKTERI